MEPRPEIGQVLAFIGLLALILAGVPTISQLLLQRMDRRQAVSQVGGWSQQWVPLLPYVLSSLILFFLSQKN